MKIKMFYHSLISDWNHGNAHFLRGIVSDLLARHHEVEVFEPINSWSMANLIRDHGFDPVEDFHAVFPKLTSTRYHLKELNLEQALGDAELVLVHEWSDPELVRKIGRHRAETKSYRLLFHDTHHRMVTAFDEMSKFDLKNYDGVLAFGQVITNLYLERELTARAWTWHEAVDTEIFHPVNAIKEGDLIWIGNWGDDERSEELNEFLIRPSSELGLVTRMHGVRYPEKVKRSLKDLGIDYRGWIANFLAPAAFSRFRFTVHVPRRPYAKDLPGIPTIRVFEALACGIPLLSAPWEDQENLFRVGKDFLIARDGKEMKKQMKQLLYDDDFSQELRKNGLHTILSRHTCRHRVDELLGIYSEMTGEKEKCRMA